MKRKFAAFLTAIVTLSASIVPVNNAVSAENEAETAEKIKILCAGDSITHGYSFSQDGYRKYLCHYLQQKGIEYDMVGPENSWSDSASYDWNGTTITYDPAHCGYSGYAIQQYGGRAGLYETMFGNGNVMETYDPDIILLQIGTNDLLDARLNPVSGTGDITETTGAYDRLESLVDKILENMDSTDVLFLASVPYIDAEVRYDWLSNYSWYYGLDTSSANDELTAKVNECVDIYNANIAALVTHRRINGYNIRFGDINSVVDVKEGLIDGVHPNETGYAAMGELWAEKISSYLENPSNGNDIGIITPTSTSTSTTTTTETTTTTTTSTSTTTTTTTSAVSESTITTTTITEAAPFLPVVLGPVDGVMPGETFEIEVEAYVNKPDLVVPVEKLVLTPVNDCGFVLESVSAASPAFGGAPVEYDPETGSVVITCEEAVRPTHGETIFTAVFRAPENIEPGKYNIGLDAEKSYLLTTGGAQSDLLLLLSKASVNIIAADEYRIADLVIISRHLLKRDAAAITAENASRYDVNSDGIIDSFDMALLRQILSEVHRVTSGSLGSSSVIKNPSEQSGETSSEDFQIIIENFFT